MPVRIYDISKKLGLENKEVLAVAKALGITAAKVPSSQLDRITAEYLEEEILKAHPDIAAKLKPMAVAPTEPKPAPGEQNIEIVKAPKPPISTPPESNIDDSGPNSERQPASKHSASSRPHPSNRSEKTNPRSLHEEAASNESTTGTYNQSRLIDHIPEHAANCIVAIHPLDISKDRVMGVGCVIGRDLILTTFPVESAAPFAALLKEGSEVSVSLPWHPNYPRLQTRVIRFGDGPPLEEHLALLQTVEPLPAFIIPPESFATMQRFTGKEYVVVGFPEHNTVGVTATGRIGARTFSGFFQLAARTETRLGGFAGSPVWSPELEAFVGLVSGANPTNCIPASQLCEFEQKLPVKFLVPESDRPAIKDRSKDDPNAELYGHEAQTNGRRFTATVERKGGGGLVKMKYEVLPGAQPAQGRFVTFLTYPDLKNYQIVSEIRPDGTATAEVSLMFADFTIAAIGDGGATRLTLNLKTLHRRKPGTEEPIAEGNIDGGDFNEPPDGGTVDGGSFEQGVANETVTGHRQTYAYYNNDQAPYANLRQRGELKDALGNKDYARQMAQLICAKLTPMPFSLGLFGDWGSGKSYFIGLLHREIEGIIKQEDNVFHRKVVQIHFNAWHYLDTSLWANLVCEIFDNLFKELIAREDTPNEKVVALKKQLAEESALAAEAKKALEDAKKARAEAEAKLLEAAQKREEQERTVAAFLDDLKHVAKDAVQQKAITDELEKVAAGFGLDRLKDSFVELEARALEARSLGGRFRSLWLAVLSPEGRGQRLGLLFAALVIPALLALGVAWLVSLMNADLAPLAGTVTSIVTLLGSAAAWISEQTKRGTNLIGQLEGAYERVKLAREERRKAEGPPEEQTELDKRIKVETEAQQTLAEAQTKVRAIESELRDLAPGRRLLKFLEQRAGANDYRQHLGLVSLVRQDFEKLSELLNDGNEPKEGDPKEPPVLNRVVLYIDDLDRCKSARVVEVLEAVHLLLAFPIFAVVVAVDPRWLRRSLVEHYPTLLLGGRNKDGEVIIESRGSLASPQDYLEKIFQVPFQLEPIEEVGFKKLVADLLPIEKKQPTGKQKKLEPKVDDLASQNLPPKTLDTASDPSPAGQAFSTQTAAKNETTAPTSVPPTQTTTQKEQPAEQRKVDPERLQLEEWERAAIQLCYPLFRTPRAVKRLANTYCLIRSGVEAAGWEQFIGSAASPVAEYRTPLLMLAVAAAYPSLARQWFAGLENASGWVPLPAVMKLANVRGEQADWDSLPAALVTMNAKEFAPLDREQVKKWLPRVKRYSF